VLGSKGSRRFESCRLRPLEKLIKAKVSAGAKTESVEEIGPGEFKIRVSAPPEKGRANIRVVELLAEHLKISRSRIFLVSGATFKEKIFSIEM
jgi:uncharacterized protein